MNKQQKFDNLSEIIGYNFNDYSYLELMLTHSSYQNEQCQSKVTNNERLEFLGDAVLELVISEELYFRYPYMMEGDLSRLRSKIVSENALYLVAEKLNLGDFMFFGKGQFKKHGKYRASILADAMEALFGAVFLDGGISEAKKLILRLCEENINAAYYGKVNVDYKSMLQEAVQKEKKIKLEYAFVDEEGPAHDKIFYYNIYLGDLCIATGEGESKKKAQQAAAKNALVKMGVINE